MIRKRPSETESFHFYNANPKDLRAADCVIRAICTATGASWEQVYRGLFDIAIQMKRVATETEAYSEYLSRIGWSKRPCPKKRGTNNRFTGVEFAKILYANKVPYPVLAHIGGHHMVCFKDGRLWDIWDSTSGAVGIVWVPVSAVGHFTELMSKY